MRRIHATHRPLLVIGLFTLAAPCAAAASDSHAKLWRNESGSVVCGIKIHQKGKRATTVLCSGKGIPRAKRGVGDPFVQLSAHGKAELVLLSQDSFEASGTPATLRTGSAWSSVGVTCTIRAKAVTCTNQSKHGFTIGSGKYKSF